jgi:hypothetical protein
MNLEISAHTSKHAMIKHTVTVTDEKANDDCR